MSWGVEIEVQLLSPPEKILLSTNAHISFSIPAVPGVASLVATANPDAP
jgi:hypothetical protein